MIFKLIIPRTSLGTHTESALRSKLQNLTREINFGSGNGLVLSGTKPLPEPILNQIFWAAAASKKLGASQALERYTTSLWNQLYALTHFGLAQPLWSRQIHKIDFRDGVLGIGLHSGMALKMEDHVNNLIIMVRYLLRQKSLIVMISTFLTAPVGYLTVS